jgi:hypothetical protein
MAFERAKAQRVDHGEVQPIIEIIRLHLGPEPAPKVDAPARDANFPPIPRDAPASILAQSRVASGGNSPAMIWPSDNLTIAFARP